MSHHKNPLLATLFALVAACSAPNSSNLTETDRTALADTIRALVVAGESAANALDAGRFLARFAPNVVHIARDTLASPSEFGGLVRGFYAGLRSQRLIPDAPPHVIVFSRDGAVAASTYSGTAVDSAGRLFRLRTAETSVFARRLGQWQIVLRQSSHHLVDAPR